MTGKVLSKKLEMLVRELDLPDDNLLDVLSIVYNFRPVATCALWPQSVRPLAPQVGILDKLAEESDCAIKEGWADNIYFFMKKSHKPDVDYFIKKHYSPIKSKDAEIAFGTLMSYPKCCIDSAVNDGKKYPAKLIPFAPCSKKCAEPWFSFYKDIYQLASRFELQPRHRQ